MNPNPSGRSRPSGGARDGLGAARPPAESDKGPLRESFRRVFAATGGVRTFYAPGRVSLIGAHLDYNGGFVFPLAIHLGTFAAARAIAAPFLRFHSLQYGETIEVPLDGTPPRPGRGWADYPAGVAAVLLEEGKPVRGAEILYDGTLPVGAGVSSSASIEVLTATVLAALGEFELAPLEKVKLCLRAENDFVGVRCGIMDQLAVTFGRRGQALLVDCLELSVERIPFDGAKLAIVLADTGVRRDLQSSPFNDRVRECQEAVEALRGRGLELRCLRDLRPEQLVEHGPALPEALRRRATHVVREIERVHAFADAFRRGAFEEAGRLVSQSHLSMRDNYETSGPELDVLVRESLEVPGVWGTRATGAGFGGCTITLLDPASQDRFRQRVGRRYRQRIGRDPVFHTVRSADGAREL